MYVKKARGTPKSSGLKQGPYPGKSSDPRNVTIAREERSSKRLRNRPNDDDGRRSLSLTPHPPPSLFLSIVVVVVPPTFPLSPFHSAVFPSTRVRAQTNSSSSSPLCHAPPLPRVPFQRLRASLESQGRSSALATAPLRSCWWLRRHRPPDIHYLSQLFSPSSPPPPLFELHSSPSLSPSFAYRVLPPLVGCCVFFVTVSSSNCYRRFHMPPHLPEL